MTTAVTRSLASSLVNTRWKWVATVAALMPKDRCKIVVRLATRHPVKNFSFARRQGRRGPFGLCKFVEPGVRGLRHGMQLQDVPFGHDTFVTDLPDPDVAHTLVAAICGERQPIGHRGARQFVKEVAIFLAQRTQPRELHPQLALPLGLFRELGLAGDEAVVGADGDRAGKLVRPLLHVGEDAPLAGLDHADLA